MCWNFQVSACFALIEAVSMVFIYLRAKRSTDPYIRGQLYVLPLLFSIFTVETVEALVWLDDSLLPVTATDGPTCSAYNKRLTLIIWLLVFPFQPFWVIFPCRRVGQVRNRDLLAVPEGMSLVFAVMHWLVYLGHVVPQWRLGDQFTPDPARRAIQKHAYQTYSNSETCMYIGQHGHLFWTLATPETWATPNVAAYTIIWGSVVAARPYRFASGFLIFTICLVLGLVAHFALSVETASVWCWTGILASAYFILQPYVLPCRRDVKTEASKYGHLPMLELEESHIGNKRKS